MKKFKKVIALGLALALIFSSMGNVFAYQLDGEDYDGIQVNETFYPTDYIVGHKAAFGNVFGTYPDSSKVILDFNGNSAKFSDYLSANPADFDVWAAAHKTAAEPKYFMDTEGNLVTIGVPPIELTVKSATAVNSTTIDVTFSDNSTARITDLQLEAGTHDVTFTYNGKSYIARNVTYTPPVVVEPTVQKVELIDYRHMKVTFSTKVDEITAEDPANYYLELVEGSAEYAAAFMGISNQLQDIDTDYPGWWDEEEGHMVASVVGGKTVVNIYLPEDSRFTNELDITGYDNDDEETIIANMSNLVPNPDGNDVKAMIKGVTTYVAVRNVRDLSGARTIDTEVLPMLILDETAPEFIGFEVVDTPNRKDEMAADRQEIELTSDGLNTVALEFNEPVFNAHGLGVDDINNNLKYNVAVYVNNILVGSRDNGKLAGVLKFAMSKFDDYDEARFATLDVRKAVERAYPDQEDPYKACREFRISIVGIPDLAGNTQVPNPVEFTAKIVDPDPVNPDPEVQVIPEVLGVVQIHDNVFRVAFNRDDVKARFEIVNADGEEGVLDVGIFGGQIGVDIDDDDEIDFFYSDVYVPAVDVETTVDNAINGKNDGILAYDNQKTINRKVRVYDVKVPEENLEGEAECIPYFTITKDIYAPDFVQPDMIEYDDIDQGQLIIHLEDNVPKTWEEVGQPVYAMLYDYNYNDDNVFEPTINVRETEDYNENGPIDYPLMAGPDLLPIKVSYIDADGNTHQALVSNKWLAEDFTWPWLSWGPSKPGWNEGYTGAIKYFANDKDLVLDISNYPQLTDENGNLIPDVTYKVEIPDGYFADPAKFNAYDLNQAGTFQVECECSYPVLYVSDGRHNSGEHSYIVRGYMADEMTVDIDVDEAPGAPVEIPDDAVPQTSKLLINYMQDSNEIWVEFTGQIKESTLIDLDNYKLNGKTLRELNLPEGAVEPVKQITNYEVEERQYAKIDLGYDTIAISGDYTFEVSGVTNEAGGEMTPVSTRIDLIENTRPVVEEAVVSGENQIVLTFDEALMYGDDVDSDEINAGYAARENFKVIMDDGTPVGPVTAVLSDEDYKTVTLTVTGVDFNECDSIIVKIALDQNEQMSLEDISANHNPINADIVTVK